MTLGGLLKHMALVEYDTFAHKMFGEAPPPPWDAVDWDAETDWEWRTAAGRFTWPDGRTPSLRRLLIDMVEEYARHAGHADLIRESIDGLVGEDPPE